MVGIFSFNNLNPEGIFFAVSNPQFDENAIHIRPFADGSSLNCIFRNISVVRVDFEIPYKSNSKPTDRKLITK